MEATEKLLAMVEIQSLKARYFRYVDTKNWDGLRNLFCPHATFDYPEWRAIVGDAGRPNVDEAVQMISHSLADAVSVHHGHMGEIEFDSPTSARAIWAMEDRLYFNDKGQAEMGLLSLHGFGHYHEGYIRRDGAWLINSLRLTRIRIERQFAPLAAS